MSSKIVCYGVVFSLLCLVGCGGEEKTVRLHQASLPQLHVINVLDEQYYNDAHIVGSENVPFDNFEKTVQAHFNDGSWNTSDRFVIYCANYQCSASSEAAKFLKSLQATDVAVYEGGMAEWKQKGYPTEGPAAESYLTMVGEHQAGLCGEIPCLSAEGLKALII